jgi:hypothetical protein
MDVESVFLNRYINELVYVEQPLGFKDKKKPNHVHKLRRALYGLKQAPRACMRDLGISYSLRGSLWEKLIPLSSPRRLARACLCCKSMLMISYLDQPIKIFEEFGKMMVSEFEMSMIRELSYFLSLQIKQMRNGTFVSQEKYIKDILKKFGMDESKAISTPMGSNGNLDSDTSGNIVD